MNWSNCIGSATAIGQELRMEDSSRVLLWVRVTQNHPGHRWLASLFLSHPQENEVRAFEEWGIEWDDISAFMNPPFEEIPRLLSFASQYGCRDEDGLHANKCYSVSISRVEAFVDFLVRPGRRLPVVVISPTRDNLRYLLTETSTMTCGLQGLAHVIVLRDNGTAQQLHRLLPKHGCYHGAVHIYWPGFKATHGSDSHPVWLASELQPTAVSAVQVSIFALIAERSPSFLPSRSSEVEDFEEHLRIEERKKQQKQRETQIEEQIESRLREEANAELEELFNAYEEIEEERNFLLGHNSELEKALSQRDHEIGRLRWERDNVWQSKQPAESEDEYIPGCRIFLSGKAYKQLDSFDPCIIVVSLFLVAAFCTACDTSTDAETKAAVEQMNQDLQQSIGQLNTEL
jgi:hypothetical protein